MAGWRRVVACALVGCTVALLGAGCGGPDTGRSDAAGDPAPPSGGTGTQPKEEGIPQPGGVPGSSEGSQGQAPPAPRPTVCAPTGGAPRWLQEGETLTVRLSCATGHTSADLRFGVDPLPAGARLDGQTLTWTPDRDQAAVYLLTLTEASTGETGTLKVGVADNFLAKGNAPIQDPARYTEEYGLPVFHLSYPEGLTSGEYRPVTLVYRGRTYDIQAKFRGASSLVFPKKSYTLEFPKEAPFSEPVFGDGFVNRRKLVLITSFNDNSYLRPRLAFDLWNRMSPAHLKVRTFSAVVVLNGRWWGLYTVADHVDKHLMRNAGLDPDGNLYKAVHEDANFSREAEDGSTKTTLHQGLEKKEGVPLPGKPGAWADLDALVAWVADSSDATFRAEYAQRVDPGDYEDWWIFNTLILGTDSAGKNAYHYRDWEAAGRFRFIPWDLDASFGQDWATFRLPPTVRDNFSRKNLLFARMLRTPDIALRMRERYRTLLQSELAEPVVQQLIDGYVAEIDACARRDWARWGPRYRAFERWAARSDFTTYEEEVAYVRRWVKQRWPALDERLP